MRPGLRDDAAANSTLQPFVSFAPNTRPAARSAALRPYQILQVFCPPAAGGGMRCATNVLHFSKRFSGTCRLETPPSGSSWNEILLGGRGGIMKRILSGLLLLIGGI